ncbi:MAG: sulfite exporter TauE/SafE family protein [Planctomycetes bacterium]|nr:sulfite exporter TauE/SafE family protein [Planctomycetota bacterium]
MGFGMGLVAVPALVWLGIALPEAMAITMAGSFVTSLISVHALRRDVPWRDVGVCVSIRGVGLGVGVVLLGLLASLDAGRVKQVVGAVLAAVVVVQWLWRVRPRERIGWGWTAPTFLISGVMAGSVGMGGPPLVLWVMAHNWSARRTRAFLLCSFLILQPVLTVILIVKFGTTALVAVLAGAVCVPAILLGTAAGLRLGRRISRPLLQKLAFTLLLLLALASALGPWLPGRDSARTPVAATPHEAGQAGPQGRP